jgi:signal transduction histidine kinase
MQAVIEDLLTMAQVADPERGFAPEPVDLRRILLDVVDECCHAAAARSQTCRVEATEEQVLVLGLPEELHRMLANLMSNAIKYSGEGRPIVAGLDRLDGEVRVHVTDTGIGISQEDQRHLFREFFRSTNPDALARSGTGLGLAIVERIVQRHAGRIELTSELGRGTTVSVTLPAHADDGVGAPDRPYAVAPGRSGYRGATPTDA